MTRRFVVDQQQKDQYKETPEPAFAGTGASLAMDLFYSPGENMLLFSDIGFWHDLVATHMPHSRFLVQTQRYDFNELTRSSILPYFATNLTLRFSDIPDDRVAVAIKDSDAAVTYYAVCLRSNAERFKGLFQ